MTDTRWVHVDVLEALMRRAGVSQRTLAARVGVHESTISRLRNGTRGQTVPADLADSLADALGVDVDTFTSRTANVVVVERRHDSGRRVEVTS